MKIALAQMHSNPAGTDQLGAGVSAIADAASRGADVVVLPELFRWPYPAQDMDPSGFDAAEPVPGPTSDAIGAAAAANGVYVVGSVFERAAPGLGFNTAFVCDPTGALVGTYRKTHIPEDPLYYEKFYFTPGDDIGMVFDTPKGRVGVLVCWDQWFPEAARLVAMKGAEVIVYPTAIGTIAEEGEAEHARQLEAWTTVQRGHAVANGVYVAAVNRAGEEGELTFWGHSFLAGPQGEFVAQADENAALLVLDVDLTRVRDVRRMWPFFRDRRIDLYGPLTRRWGH